MAAFRTFKDIEAWQEARALNKLVYRLTTQGDWAKDFALRDQIRRATISIASNIAEGFERRGDTEFRRFLIIAKASAAEVKTQLYLAFDLEYMDRAVFSEAISSIDKVSRLIGGLIKHLAQRDVLNTQ